MLVEFASVVDAVRCAVEVQRGMAERNARSPAERSHRFPHRHQCRRHHHRRRRHLRRRRQCRGAARRRWPSRAAFASPSRCIRAGARQDRRSPSTIMGEQRSRTSTGRCASIAFDLRRRTHRARLWRSARSAAARQAVDRGAAVPEHERRSRAGIFRRRHGRGHHHRAVALQVAVRDRPQFELHLQGHAPST